MSSVRARKWHQDLETIFGGGTLSALSDGQLLELFLGRRAEAGEQAFGALAERHGPMVYRVCGQVLGDSHEAQDAFQAVFIVLARKAGAVRNRESLGSWLYGVALRVAARARTDMKRRRARERQAEDGNDEIPAPAAEAPGHTDDAEAVHQEVGRLAEKYRAPIVLCYLEGLTHDQAAARLGWPVGTVRSRLARAREQLRRTARPPRSDSSGCSRAAGRLARLRGGRDCRCGHDCCNNFFRPTRRAAGDDHPLRMPRGRRQGGDGGAVLEHCILFVERSPEDDGTRKAGDPGMDCLTRRHPGDHGGMGDRPRAGLKAESPGSHYS